MFKRKHLAFITCTLSIILSACGASATPAPASITTNTPPPPQPDSPKSTPMPTPEPISSAALALEFTHEQNNLIVVSSATGKRFDAFAPIELGQNYSYTFSSDGRTLALVSNGQLYFIDLPSWKYRSYDVGLHGWLSAIMYSPDQTLLALASGDSDNNLHIVNTTTGAVTATAKVGFAIRQIKFTADGKALMVYGPQLAKTGVAANAGVSVGDPKVALLALPDLSRLWLIELSGIRHGTFPKKADSTITEDIYHPGAATHYEPGIAFSPNENILYLIHGDEDKLTTVNFADRKINTVDIKAPTTWLDRLLALTADPASAKGMDGTTKQAVISPDGKYLYVVGSSETFSASTNGDANMSQAFLGLQVISTEDGTLVDHQALDAYQTMLSPDRKYILLTGWNNVGAGIPWMDIYGMASHSILKHIDHVTATLIHRLDGEVALISNEYFNNDTCRVAMIDPSTWTMGGGWQGNCINWLTTP
jgi:DNA-binding beta-propeller fold protein YncE